MSLPLLGVNLGLYSLQVALLLMVGLTLPTLLGLRDPLVRLRLDQGLLLATLSLPFLQPWWSAAPGHSTVSWAFRGAALDSLNVAGAGSNPPLWNLLFLALGAGALGRILWLGAGMAALTRLGRGAAPLEPLPPAVARIQERLGVRALFMVSAKVNGPVTFGWRAPVVIVPADFGDLPPESQEGIACHELLHIRRNDWLFILIEEGARALLWFHPLVWVLLDRIGLSREQAVDREVVRITGRRKAYLEALVRLSRPAPESFPAPALMFRRHSHLLQRVALLSKEAFMSKSRMFLSLGSLVALLALTVVAGAVLFPIVWPHPVLAASTPDPAPPKAKAPDSSGAAEKADKAAITQPAPKLIHKVDPQFPEEAKKKGKSGKVVAEILISEKGTVDKVKILKSDDKVFEQPAIEALSQWKYEPQTKDGKPVSRLYTITVAFKLQ
jgi:TonB family protein